jgi:hypothetical protein
MDLRINGVPAAQAWASPEPRSSEDSLTSDLPVTTQINTACRASPTAIAGCHRGFVAEDDDGVRATGDIIAAASPGEVAPVNELGALPVVSVGMAIVFAPAQEPPPW